MSLQLVLPDYRGQTGIQNLRNLHTALAEALAAEEWDKVRRLDNACASVMEKVMAANRNDKVTLVLALGELKNVYAQLTLQCQRHLSAQAGY